MNIPRWLLEIESTANMMPFGVVTFNVKRHRNKTTILEIVTHSRLKYVKNDQAFADLEQLMNNLIESGYTGELQFKQTFKNGMIETQTIKNKKIVNYRDK